jgi:hypothetical protein
MIRSCLLVATVGLAAIVAAGCSGQKTPEVKKYQVQMPTGVERAKQVLQNYANGAPVGSEATTFSEIVDEVKKTDPQKGALLEKGFAEIRQSQESPAEKAKALLGQL